VILSAYTRAIHATETDDLDSSLSGAERNSRECWPKTKWGHWLRPQRLTETNPLYHSSLPRPGSINVRLSGRLRTYQVSQTDADSATLDWPTNRCLYSSLGWQLQQWLMANFQTCIYIDPKLWGRKCPKFLTYTRE